MSPARRRGSRWPAGRGWRARRGTWGLRLGGTRRRGAPQAALPIMLAHRAKPPARASPRGLSGWKAGAKGGPVRPTAPRDSDPRRRRQLPRQPHHTPKALVGEVDRLHVHHRAGAVDQRDVVLAAEPHRGGRHAARAERPCIQTCLMPSATHSRTTLSAAPGGVAMTTASTPPGMAARLGSRDRPRLPGRGDSPERRANGCRAASHRCDWPGSACHATRPPRRCAWPPRKWRIAWDMRAMLISSRLPGWLGMLKGV